MISNIEILVLGRNLGHQRAITIALSHINDILDYDAVIIMDSDGEDSPSDIIRLIQAHEDSPQNIIFAKRNQRSENGLFMFFYQIYKYLFMLFTSHTINFGNFSLIPNCNLKRLVMTTDIWNHYPAGVIKSKIPFKTIDTTRSKRLSGKSKMVLPTLFLHGLSSISVFGETIGIRALIATSVIFIISMVTILIVIGIRLSTDLAIPGWASSLVSIFIVMVIQLLMLTFLFIFIVLQSRNISSFIPARDYKYFILEKTKIY